MQYGIETKSANEAGLDSKFIVSYVLWIPNYSDWISLGCQK